MAGAEGSFFAGDLLMRNHEGLKETLEDVLGDIYVSKYIFLCVQIWQVLFLEDEAFNAVECEGAATRHCEAAGCLLTKKYSVMSVCVCFS